MGTDHGFPEEAPVHEVRVGPFYLDRYEVTNARFAEFVKATGYVTRAEKFRWSIVFDRKQKKWVKVDEADWRRPTGPDSTIEGKGREPVTQICWDDAVAYCRWARRRLPTEAEWEFAARGGLAEHEYAWGMDLNPDGKFMANYWQGTFPEFDKGSDGYLGPAPVGSFPSNAYGLYDISGNVWEWVADFFSPAYYSQSLFDNPRGPEEGREHVLRSGSFLCAANYCNKYRVAGRMHSEPDSAWNHAGFRCAADLEP